MAKSSLPIARFRLAQLSSHLVIALIALVVVGGATRVMEAGLACPDWPLCFGSFLPGAKMNLQVFLEWFHRLDAFLVGLGLISQFICSIVWRNKLPLWFPLVALILVLLVLLQGGLGALTVLNLLKSEVVTAHLALGLVLVGLMSGLTQVLLETNASPSPIWWRFLSGGSLLLVIIQCLLGGRMATSWAAQKCITQGQACHFLDIHRFAAIPMTLFILTFISVALFHSGWTRNQWPLLVGVLVLISAQISLGLLTVTNGLSIPLVTVAHQLVASLLVAFLSALAFKRPKVVNSQPQDIFNYSSLKTCHG